MAVDELRHAFKTCADPTRLRLLFLLEREELAVHELMEVLGMAQSTVSRHLGILREAGLLRDRRDGTFVYYRLVPPADGAWQEVWSVTKRALRRDPDADRDLAALSRILERRALRSKSWFDTVAPQWDQLRAIFDDDAHRARAITKLVPRGLLVADVGTGTGILARELADAGLRVIAVDHSRRMLEAARQNLAQAGPDVVERVELRHGEAGDLPLGDGEVDAAFAHMVLQHVPSPADAVREMARVVRPGGRVVVVDFVEHDRDWMRDKLGVQWQGFPPDTARAWFTQAGLDAVAVEITASDRTSDRASDRAHDRASDIPATFIASGYKPGGDSPP